MLILILLGIIAGAGALLYIHHRLTFGSGDTPASGEARQELHADDGAGADGCCGRHAVCEKDSLIAGVSESIEYFDDEELDRFRGRDSGSYLETEEEEFREVLLTMRPDEVASWARSLSLRGVELPAAVRDELLLIVAERRGSPQIS